MSGGAHLPVSQCELKRVNSVQFEVFKAEQIKKYAVCLVDQCKTYEKGVAVEGGLNDPRMGTTDFDEHCSTCKLSRPMCPGHFGYLELAEPMFSLGMFDTVLTVLKCVCKVCGELLVDPQSNEVRRIPYKTGNLRLREVAHLSKLKCGWASKHDKGGDDAGKERGCGAEQDKTGRYIGNYPGLVVKSTKAEQDVEWYADRVRTIFDKISDENAAIMGFQVERCHPRDLLLTVLPIPPPHVRPGVSFGSAKSDNELSTVLLKIIKLNQILRKKKEDGEDSGSLKGARVLLQEAVGTYFHNSSTYYKPCQLSVTLKLKSITERLKGKYGRLRGNLMGKRVDFSARTVITGDPNIDVDEVGVPFSIAMTLTFPERVNAINRKRLTEFVRRDGYPSANYIIHQNETITPLEKVKDRTVLNLQIGDIVERHVINGDVVLFNRQPTLHRMSMMGHRVRVLNYNTFRLNLSCTTPYNADFDGDEMNLHVPQSLLNKAELIELMMVPKNFVSPNKSAPCMGIVQDSLLGCYRITDKETFLDKFFVQSVAMWIDRWELPIPAILKPRPLWTGKQIFSLVLPKEINIHNDAEKHRFCLKDEMLLIRQGQHLCGPIKKGTVGASPGSLIHVIFNEMGSDAVATFINGVQRVTAFFLYNVSFSVGVEDTILDQAILGQINEVLMETRQLVIISGAAANTGSLARKAGMNLLQSFEMDVNQLLNKCREDSAKKALSSVGRTNSFKVMIDAGSKGTDLNICQIAVLVGQQNVNGQRIPFQFRRRTLPHFMLDDYGELARGMVTHGYVEGLMPQEFFFHTMGGREGLIDTAVKTAATGYLQRKLIKALEDVHAAYDGTVRNANRDVLQFVYGEDGLDGARIEGSQPFPLPSRSNTDMEKIYKYEYEANGAFLDHMGDGYLSDIVKRRMRADSETVTKLNGEFQQLINDRDASRTMIELESNLKLNLPVNVDRLIRNAQVATASHQHLELSDLDPTRVIECVTKLQHDLRQLFASYNKLGAGMFLDTPEGRHSEGRVKSALCLFSMHLRQTLASRRVIKEYRLNAHSFQSLLSEIRSKYQQSMIHPGEMIGAIAAQSCGEPATQMTLNTFHNAGISSKNVTLGVPRLLELLNVSKNQKNTSMLVRMTPNYVQKKKTQKAQHCIEYCTLETITRRVQIVYEPDPKTSCIADDTVMVHNEWYATDEADHPKKEREVLEGSPWVVRLELINELINDKDLERREIKKLCKRNGNEENYIIEVNYENNKNNDKPCIMRFRPRKNEAENSIPHIKKTIPPLLSNVHLRGIEGVTKAILKEVTVFPVNADCGIKTDKEWAVDTEGTALKKVFAGVYDTQGSNMIDFSKTSSNKIPEICQLLGIEAARLKLMLELREAYLAYSVSINYRHYTTLVDTMSQRGYLMAVSRVGINRSDMSGPLMRCSFEETVKVLMGAAAFGERDPVRGVSANIILGNQARIGTGLFDLMLDVSALKMAVPQELAVMPGPIGNMYHGADSAVIVSSGYHGGAPPATAARTPLVTDRNAVGAPNVESVAYSAEYYDHQALASPYHQSQLYNPLHPKDAPQAHAGTYGGFGQDFSNQYSQLWKPANASVLLGSNTTSADPEVHDSPAYQSSYRSAAERPYVPSSASASRAGGGSQPPAGALRSSVARSALTEEDSQSYVPASVPYGAATSGSHRSGSHRTPGAGSFASHDFSPNEEDEESNE